MFEGQIEMSFETGSRWLPRRQRRLTRAQWWFQRMRQVVDRAMDWQPVPPSRPEQLCLPGTQRTIDVAAQSPAPAMLPQNPDERQICE
jgi:hypothetical protein